MTWKKSRVPMTKSLSQSCQNHAIESCYNPFFNALRTSTFLKILTQFANNDIFNKYSLSIIVGSIKAPSNVFPSFSQFSDRLYSKHLTRGIEGVFWNFLRPNCCIVIETTPMTNYITSYGAKNRGVCKRWRSRCRLTFL